MENLNQVSQGGASLNVRCDRNGIKMDAQLSCLTLSQRDGIAKKSPVVFFKSHKFYLGWFRPSALYSKEG